MVLAIGYPMSRLDTLRQDLSYAKRKLRRSPVFTLIATCTLALGIGATTALFTLVDQVVLQPLPYRAPERLVEFLPEKTLTVGWYLHLESHQNSMEQVSGYRAVHLNLTQENRTRRVSGASVASTHFQLLGVEALHGRTFQEQDVKLGREGVVVLSHRIWQDVFGSDLSVLDQPLLLEGRAVDTPPIVIGILPPDFRPISETWDFWLPIERHNTDGPANLQVIGRLSPGTGIADARRDAKVQLAALRELSPHRIPQERVDQATAIPLQEAIVGETRRTLVSLLLLAIAVLAIACVNVANLLLARGEARIHEVSVRLAVGAPRQRLVRQLVTESLLLASLGGAAGLAVGALFLKSLSITWIQEIPRGSEVQMDLRVFLFATALTLAVGLLFGLAPAWRLANTNLLIGLGQPEPRRFGRRTSLSSVLIAVEIGLATFAAVLAGLVWRSAASVANIDPGFTAAQAVTFRLSPEGSEHSGVDRKRALYEELSDSLRAWPEVESVGVIGFPPLTGLWSNWGVLASNSPLPANQSPPRADQNLATPETFQALGIPLVKGRFFLESDRDGSPDVCIVSHGLATVFWPDESAIGQTLTLGQEGGNRFEVVGVVGDVHQSGLSTPSQPTFYTPLAQWPYFSDLWVVARTTTQPEGLLPEISGLVRRLAPRVPITELQTMEDVVWRSNRLPRASSRLFLAFAMLALFLGAVGVYGVLSMTLAGKRRDLAVRMAIGAPSRAIFRYVFANALPPLVIGLTLGVIAAAVIARRVSEMLVKVSPGDPVIFGTTIALVSLVAGVAIWIPARRATQTQPSEALRVE